MIRTFIQTREFSKNWDKLGFVDDDLRELENQIMMNPKQAPVIPGTGKLRKMRFALQNRSKRDSVRICYVDFDIYEIVYLITVYPKNEKDTISKQECNNIKKMIYTIEINLRGDD